MSFSLKDKTISGLSWSFIDNISNQGINFVIGIVLARILSPGEFGIFGILLVFIAISNIFVDSGLSQALIRKECSKKDYDTAFVFNIVIGLIFYGILFFFAPLVAVFFSQPHIVSLLRAIGIIVIINSFGLVQYTILIKRVAFKTQTKISILSSLCGGIVGIYLAYDGYGVWALVGKQIVYQIFQTILLWIYVKWKPAFEFNKISFKYLFKFGSKLLISGLIDTIYKNVVYLVIGKKFPTAELGYYTRSEQYSGIASNNITTTIQRVSYPILSTIADEKKLRRAFKKMTSIVMYISFVLMFGMAACAKPLILTLIGDKWIPSIVMLQLLCFSQMLYPFHALNLNILNVKGRSDLFLRVEIIKKLLLVPFICLGLFWSIKAMLMGFILYSILCVFINAFYTRVLLGIRIITQLRNILMPFLTGLSLFLFLCILSKLLTFASVINLTVLILAGMFFMICSGEFFKNKEYLELKNIVLQKINQLREKIYFSNISEK